MSMMSVTCIKDVSLASQIPQNEIYVKILGGHCWVPEHPPSCWVKNDFGTHHGIHGKTLGNKKLKACAGTPGLY